MLKEHAIRLLGGSVAIAAKKIGVTYQAVDKWPAELPARIEDRVLAALARESKDVRALLESAQPASAAITVGEGAA